MVGGGSGGGQLAQAIKNHCYPTARGTYDVDLTFLCGRLPSFLIDSRWPKVFDQHFNEWIDYAYDLPGRASWKSATRQEWIALIQNKLPRAMRLFLPTCAVLFTDESQHQLCCSTLFDHPPCLNFPNQF